MDSECGAENEDAERIVNVWMRMLCVRMLCMRSVCGMVTVSEDEEGVLSELPVNAEQCLGGLSRGHPQSNGFWDTSLLEMLR